MECVTAFRSGARVCAGRVAGPSSRTRPCGLGSGRARAGRDARPAQLTMGRADSLAKLAWAYGIHLTRRRLTRPRSQLQELFETYGADGIRALLPAERERHPHLIGCINCGLCALAAGRIGTTRLPGMGSSYMRLYARLGDASADIDGDEPDLKAAASACPVGVPLDEVAAIVRRLAAG